jgi:hypothetical protein
MRNNSFDNNEKINLENEIVKDEIVKDEIVKDEIVKDEILKDGKHKIHIKKKKITEFTILKYSEYNILNEKKYQVSQLKKMCQFYKQKVSGNKDELQKRMYNFLKYSYFVYKIQRTWKRKVIRKLIKARGPGYKERNKCVNEIDFYTMETLEDIPSMQFISFKDKEGVIYGFNILSLYNLILRTKLPLINPYTRGEIDKSIIENLYSIIKITKRLGSKVELQIEEPKQLSREKKIEMRALELFQNINDLGNYSNQNWFLKLNKLNLIRFIRQLIDIWNYRAQLSDNVRREICPPYGDPYRDVNVYVLPSIESLELQEISLKVIDRLVNSGINSSSKALGANFVLCALTLVNKDAAEALPWLYESVAPDIQN